MNLFLWKNKFYFSHFSKNLNQHRFFSLCATTSFYFLFTLGTKLQVKVWNYLKKIPKGKVKTYLEVAKAIGKARAVRAVANAIGKNPFPPKIPCHRVIRSDVKLGGYSAKGGIKTKKKLLKNEGFSF